MLFSACAESSGPSTTDDEGDGPPSALALGDSKTVTQSDLFDPNTGDANIDYKARVTLLKIEPGSKPDHSEFDQREWTDEADVAGKPWVRLQFKIANLGKWPIGTVDFTVRAIDSEGEQHSFDWQAPVFKPDIFRSDFQPGDTQVGYTGIPVPAGTKLKRVQIEMSSKLIEWEVPASASTVDG